MARPLCPDCRSALSRRERAGGICGSCGAAVRPPEPQPTAAASDNFRHSSSRHPSAEHASRASMLGLARKQAALSLFVIAALSLICGGLSAFAERPAGIDRESGLEWAVIAGISLVFAGLGGWALRMPIPPAVIGLVLFAGMTGLDLLADPPSAARGMLFRVFIAALLFRAIGTAIRAGGRAASDGDVREYDD